MSLRKIYISTPFLIFEFIVFYVFIPFIVNKYFEGWYKIVPLLLIAGTFLILLLTDPEFDNRVFTRFRKDYAGKSVVRIVIISLLLIWFTWWIYPDLFLSFPLENFNGYVITFFLYPVASVFPQEIIYRVYFFHRYESIIPEKYLLMLSNAIIFGLTHFIYANWVAPIATFLVSWVFIYNYYQTKSWLNVSLEHYLYGIIMFTIGFGYFFQ